MQVDLEDLSNKNLPYPLRWREQSSVIGEFLTGNNSEFVQNFRKNTNDLIYSYLSKKVEGSDPIPPRKILEISYSDLHLNDLNRFVMGDLPVIIRGFGNGMKAVDTWTPLWFKEKFGEIKFDAVRNNFYHSQKEIKLGSDANVIADVQNTTVAELIDDMFTGNKTFKRLYAQFQSEIFDKAPEILEDIDIEKVAKVARTKNPLNKNLLIKLFMGGTGTGTNWHNAPMHNLFLQIYGKKRWKICDSRYLHTMYAKHDVKATYYVSPIVGENPDYIKYPLYRYCPYYEGEIDAGDLLVLPQFWMHCVVNPTPSIGCSMWWLPFSMNLRKEFLWSFFFYSRPHLWLRELPESILFNKNRMFNDSVSVRRLYYTSLNKSPLTKNYFRSLYKEWKKKFPSR